MYTTIHTNFIARDVDISTNYCNVIIKRVCKLDVLWDYFQYCNYMYNNFTWTE